MKRLVLKAIPDEATRLAALKHGEVDIAYALRGTMAEEVQRTPGLMLKPNVGQATQWVYSPEPRAAGRRVGDRCHPGIHVLRAVRGPEVEGEVK